MGRITIAQLEAFYWVAELGAVHKAAGRLNVTQPTVSLRLRQLEAELVAPVLEPHGRGVRVTLAGQAFLAKVALSAEKDAKSRARAAQAKNDFRPAPVYDDLAASAARRFKNSCSRRLPASRAAASNAARASS